MHKIKVAVYEDNIGLRDILTSIIRETEDLELAGEFGHCLDAVKNTKAFNPDVVIMDIDMPGRSGIEGVKDIKKYFPEVEIIMNTVFDDESRIFNAIEAGATGYLLKNYSLRTLLSCIRDVMAGGAPMSPSIARKVLTSSLAKKEENPAKQILTERELSILNLLSKGLSYKMVSDELYLSIDTVRSHIKRIYDKLHVHSVTEAVHRVFIDKNT
ncbi:MAG: response regulator transcription factor [Saprospiraceae bacterium]|nr:response regulator transcription factor [Saprospiraceae bacterium]